MQRKALIEELDGPNAAARVAAARTILEENERAPAGNNMPQVSGFATLIADARPSDASRPGDQPDRSSTHIVRPIASAAIDQQCRSSRRSWNLAPAAPSPGSAAAAATPAATAPAATHAATAATTAAMATAVGDLHFAANVFLIEEMERS